MTTISRPANGYGGFSDADWALRFGAQDGLIEDYEGNALDITLLNDTNEAQFNGAAGRTGPDGTDAAIISVNGFHMLVPDGERVPLPAPVSGTVTYYIGGLYDPSLNIPIPDSDPPQASEQGPVRLVALTSPIDLSGDKRFLVQWEITRTFAALTGAAKSDRRRWVGTTLDYADGLSDVSLGNEGRYPRGTIRAATNRLVIRRPNAARTALEWQNVLSSAAIPLPLKSTFIARKDKGAPAAYSRNGNSITLEGQIQRLSGNLSSGTTVELGTMPEGARPGPGARSFICKCGGSNNYTEVRINSDNSTDGKILMTDPPSSTAWLDLSGITYRIGA